MDRWVRILVLLTIGGLLAGCATTRPTPDRGLSGRNWRCSCDDCTDCWLNGELQPDGRPDITCAFETVDADGNPPPNAVYGAFQDFCADSADEVLLACTTDNAAGFGSRAECPSLDTAISRLESGEQITRVCGEPTFVGQISEEEAQAQCMTASVVPLGDYATGFMAEVVPKHEHGLGCSRVNNSRRRGEPGLGIGRV